MIWMMALMLVMANKSSFFGFQIILYDYIHRLDITIRQYITTCNPLITLSIIKRCSYTYLSYLFHVTCRDIEHYLIHNYSSHQKELEHMVQVLRQQEYTLQVQVDLN